MKNDERARLAALEQVCAEMYQVAGAIGAPLRLLDQLDAAANGKPLPHETVLPFDASECVPLPSVAAAALAARGKGVSTPKKAKAARLNGQKYGGRPAKFSKGDRVRCTDRAPAHLRGMTGEITRRGVERAQFYVRQDKDGTSVPVRTWWMEKEAALDALR